MDTKLTVEIVTPEKRVLTAQAEEVVIPGAEGLFGVRPGHTPYLALLRAGTLTVRDGQDRAWFIPGGFAEVSADKVVVLADRAEPVTEIDVAAAQQRLDQAQAQLPTVTPEEARVLRAKVDLERARLNAAAGR